VAVLVLILSVNGRLFQRLPLFVTFQVNYRCSASPGRVMEGTIASRIAPRPKLICGSSGNEPLFKSYGVSTGATYAFGWFSARMAWKPLSLLACQHTLEAALAGRCLVVDIMVVE